MIMKSNRDYVVEENINEIENLLNSSSVVSLTEGYLDNLECFDTTDLIDESFPGYLNLRMDVMKMHLFMTLKAPVNSSNEITLMDIKTQVELLGPACEQKINWDVVNDIYSRVMSDGEIVPESIIAKGTPCSFHIPSYIKLKDGLEIDYTPRISHNECVDYHKIRSIIHIKQGEFIGEIIPEVVGEDGINLLGERIKATNKIINTLNTGDNIVVQNSRIYAGISGALKIIDDQIHVDEILNISGDVDYSTGDIDFSGDIFITGSIREGFIVDCERDMVVLGSIEPTNITCGNNLKVQHGIIGSNKYSIDVEGSIYSLHAENAHINSIGSVVIENGVLNCEINTLDTLFIGKNNSMTGGKYHSLNGIIAGNIGNDSIKETQIFLGTDYKVENKLLSVQKTSIELNEQMNKLQILIRNSDNREEKDKMKNLFLEIKNQLNRLNNFSRELLTKLDKNDKSSLIVLDTVYPGTYIEICHISYMVKEKLHRVKFTLDKCRGVISITSL